MTKIWMLLYALFDFTSPAMSNISDPKKIEPSAITPKATNAPHRVSCREPISRYAPTSMTRAPAKPNTNEVSIIPKRYWSLVKGPTRSWASIPHRLSAQSILPPTVPAIRHWTDMIPGVRKVRKAVVPPVVGIIEPKPYPKKTRYMAGSPMRIIRVPGSTLTLMFLYTSLRMFGRSNSLLRSLSSRDGTDEDVFQSVLPHIQPFHLNARNLRQLHYSLQSLLRIFGEDYR